jgi:acyl-CoA synthetase (AMP-forming)/AMP-acid ligase II
MPIDVTLRNVLSSGAARRPALYAPDSQLSLNYEQLRGTIDSLSEQLARLGLGRGDRIALALPNGPEAILMFLAAGLTATAAPLNPGYTEDEFRFYLADTRAKALVLPAEGGGTPGGQRTRDPHPPGRR